MKAKYLLPVIGISVFSLKNFIFSSIGDIPLDFVLAIYETLRIEPFSFFLVLLATYPIGVALDKITSGEEPQIKKYE